MPMIYNRNPLRDRAKPMASDVADAIEMILALADAAQPLAIAKAHIVAKLIEIAQTDEAGVYTAPSGPAANAMAREFANIITNTATFQSGYKNYEKRAARPVVPVVDYFFRVIYGGGEVTDVLDAMTDFEISQSLPKRRGRARDDAGEFRRDEETGEILMFGELAGIVVFPPNSRHTLLWKWLERRSNNTVGHVNGTVARIEHATPGDLRLAAARATADAFNPQLKQAALMPPPDEEEADHG